MDDFGPHPSEQDGSSGGCLRILLSLVIEVILIAVLLWQKGLLDRLRITPSDDGTKESRVPAEGTDPAVVDALQQFHRAQQTVRAEHGEYAAATEDLVGVAGVDSKTASATDPAAPYHGYYFTCPRDYARRRLDPAKEFIVAAEPAEYGKTGTFTYVIGPKGIVLGKDMGGRRITNVSQIDKTWQQVR